MICFKDMTFCKSDCTNHKCTRYFGEEERLGAERWWGGKNAPVAFSDFSDTCEEYRND